MLSYHVECLFYIYWNRTFWIKQIFITVLCICRCYEINWLSYTITSYSECNFSESLLTSVTETCLLLTTAPLASSKAFLERRLYHCLLLNDSRKLWTNMFDTLTTTVLPDRNQSNQPLAALSCASSIPRFWQFLPPSLQHSACDRQSFCMCLSDRMSYNFTCGCLPFLGPIKHFAVALQENMELQSFL